MSLCRVMNVQLLDPPKKVKSLLRDDCTDVIILIVLRRKQLSTPC